MKIRLHRRHSILFIAMASLLAACGDANAPVGDLVHGKELYAQCAGCHEMTSGHAAKSSAQRSRGGRNYEYTL